MEVFLRVSLSFPTVIYSFLLLIAVIYWLIVAAGLLEVDILDLEADSMMEGAGQTEGLAGLLYKFKLNDAPVTLILTLLFFFSWLICYFAELWLLRHLPLGLLHYPLGALMIPVAALLSIPLCAALCRPLRPLFRKVEATNSKSILGQVALVRSGRVTASQGEALLEDGGAGLILRIRADESHEFKRGDRVVLLEFLPAEHAYRVISEDEFRG